MAQEAKKKVSKIAALPLEPKVGEETMALYRELAKIFTHPWRFDLTHYLDGLPSIHVEVHPPYEDLFIYDDRVIECIEKHMPEGYFFDGTGHACQARDDDGSGERDYFIYPKKRE